MATSAVAPLIDPQTGERVAAPQIDPATGERVGSAPAKVPPGTIDPTLPPDVAADGWRAAVHAKMLGTSPGFAYENRDEIDKQMRSVAGNYDDGEIDPGIMNDIKVGLEGSIFGMMKRNKLPDQLRNPGKIDSFVKGISETVADVPFMLMGGAAGGAAGSEIPVAGTAVGAAAGAFALPAAVRQALTTGIKNGQVTSFSDLLRRSAGVVWAGAKGAITGAATEAAGGIPVGGLIAKSGVASMAVKGLYQATALTATADLLEGKVPDLNDFAGNAALIVPLNLITHGVAMKAGEARQAQMDIYADSGVTPQETTAKLEAQPTVKADPAPGLKPAINVGDSPIEANADEHHAELAQRVMRTKPVTMYELEADPALADKVLQNPAIHDQPEIDRAWQLKKEAIDSGQAEPEPDADASQGPPKTIEELYNRGEMKSGRGFTTPDGKFLEREQAKAWVKKNEPAIYEKWKDTAGDEKAPFDSEDYQEARSRTSAQHVASGEPDYSAMTPEMARFIGIERAELNKIKASDKLSSYGKSVLRTLFVGPRNAIRAEADQVVSGIRKLLPDFHDQEALSFLRDYRDAPDELRSAIEEVRAGSNEKLKAFIPSMERALNPTPAMLQADARMTQYFTKALDLGRQVGTLDSTIDPARYSPRLFMKATEDAEQAKGVGRLKFTEKTANAIRREHLRILDPLKSGDFEARTFNAADELGVYADRHAIAVATKLFTTELKNSEMGKWGSAATVPEGWVQLAPDQRGFHQSITVKDAATGETHTFSRGLYVPKMVADAMKPMLQAGGLPEQIGKILHSQQYVKALELSMSPFHMKAMTVTAMNNMSLGDFMRALKSDNASAAFEAGEREGALWGLETTKTGTPYEAYKGLKPSSLPTGLDKLRNLPVLKQVDALAQSITHETFDVVQRKFKVMDFAQKQAAWIAKHPDAAESEYGSAMRGIAKEVNAAYGGLNWDVMGVSKQMRDISRLFILAPDWTFSNVANLKYTFEGGPHGSAARQFWVKSFVTGIALSQGMSKFVGGQFNGPGHLTDVYLGKDKDGKEMYSNMFFAGAPKDAITLVNRVGKDGLLGGLVGFMANKFGPIASTFLHLAENKQFSGKPISKPGAGPGEKTIDQTLFAGGNVLPVPFGLKDVAQMLTDGQDHSLWEYMLPLVGMNVQKPKEEGGTTPAKKVLPGGGKKSKGFSIRGAR